MKPNVDARGIRAILAGILASDLSEEELRLFAARFYTDESLRDRAATALQAALDGMDGPSPQREPVRKSPTKSNFWSESAEERLVEKLMGIAENRDWSASQLQKAQLRLLPSLFPDTRRRLSPREFVRELATMMSPTEARQLIDRLNDDRSVPADPFLQGILDKGKKP